VATIGTIRKIDLEGGFFGIITDDGEQLFPLNLGMDFRKDGLRVQFEFEHKPMFTAQMWGMKGYVTDITAVDDQN
jgi:hypothetical protein